ncbi:MAG: hypothetical protein GY950_19815, partial [bacterium]|nr:hypothetical protein [bacterium]
MPRFVTRHINRCGACRDFAALSGSLSSRLVRDAEAILQGSNESLEERIISALEEKPRVQRLPRRHYLPLPALAAALVVVAAALGVIFQVIPFTTPGNSSEYNMSDLPRPVNVNNVLQNIAGRVESPIESEMASLEKTVKSAAEHLLTDLDIKSTFDPTQDRG